MTFFLVMTICGNVYFLFYILDNDANHQIVININYEKSTQNYIDIDEELNLSCELLHV